MCICKGVSTPPPTILSASTPHGWKQPGHRANNAQDANSRAYIADARDAAPRHHSTADSRAAANTQIEQTRENRHSNSTCRGLRKRDDLCLKRHVKRGGAQAPKHAQGKHGPERDRRRVHKQEGQREPADHSEQKAKTVPIEKARERNGPQQARKAKKR